MLSENLMMDSVSFDKLQELNNQKVMDIVSKYVSICRPSKVTVIDDSKEDIDYVRSVSLDKGEENILSTEGHTIHYDGYYDQARDKKNTRVLLPKNKKLSSHINSIERESGISEIFDILEGIMEGKEMFVRFFSLGPVNSKFSISALQITDSAYVAHSEDLLYRQGYEQFKKLTNPDDFFHLIHSAGSLENSVSKDLDNRRIYIDLKENRVISVNNQYAGNSLGLKKLCLRLAINKSVGNGWLTEHMFISGVYSLDKSRKTYFLGAFPSSCGKTSTAMIPGHTIVGDDIAYLRFDENGYPFAANIEQGIFGIIKDVNPIDDPLIYKVITSPREMIFSNVLQNNGKTYWLGMNSQNTPTNGINHSGNWTSDKTDENGNSITISHPNARYTIRIEDLENVDENLHNPNGVKFSGILYGGRDSDTAVPISQAFNWDHGVLYGASIESETTAATLGQVGVRKHQPMSNLDFLVVPLGKYLQAHHDFGKEMNEDHNLSVFSTNYFLKNEKGQFYDDKVDKKVWLIWAEGRINKEFEAIETPVGLIPKFDDLSMIFRKVFKKEYTKERYDNEFSIRIDKYLDKIDRIQEFYSKEENIPDSFINQINEQRSRLESTKSKFSSGVVLPESFFS